MPKENYAELINNALKDAENLVSKGGGSIQSRLPEEITRLLDIILLHVEGSKGVLAVILTSLLYKIFHKDQDIRLHQKSIPGGYSGRTFDTRYITPFLKKNNFPAMAESGWLTRSLEQKSPYTLSYKGSIKPSELKASFLKTLDYIEKGAPCGE